MYNPTWKEYEKDLQSGDPNKELEAAEAFTKARDNETAKSAKARKWEADRKKEAYDHKPQWVKERIQKEREELNKPFKDLKKAGVFHDLTPAPGFILVEITQKQTQTESGIILANVEESEPNTGTVIACGSDKQYVNVQGLLDFMPCPVKEGQKILFKKFAGMDAIVDGGKCRLMQFTDVLALVK